MISQTAEYALRAIVFLADHEGESHTSERISATTKVPVGYLSKILQGLVRAGLVNSQRGPYGGFTLAVSSEKLTVYDVVQAVDPIHRIHGCPLEISGHGVNLCPLHRLLDNVVASVERSFRKVTIHSLLLDREGGSHPLCEFPRQELADNAPAVRRPKPGAS
ncbi:MAG: Rrf2 family transcriptional regulator [Planctomycetota bacterium]|nr:Rrf2 family transcriptional regulator [Planctomycetota bacterium]